DPQVPHRQRESEERQVSVNALTARFGRSLSQGPPFFFRFQREREPIMPNAFKGRKKAAWFAGFGLGLALAAAAYWWTAGRSGTPVAGEPAADRQPASARGAPGHETQRPERGPPPPGRFF